MREIRVRTSPELQDACAAVGPGDVILVHAGTYDQPAKLLGKHGALANPIAIRAADDGWISGGKAPDPFWSSPPLPSEDAPGKPSDRDFAFLVIDDCAFVSIDGLKIRECWPSIFFVKDTTHLTIRNCTLRHATYAIFAKGASSHLLIDGNEWQQDDSPEHLLWTTFDWRRAHGNEGSDGLLRYFNGGFLAAKAIVGNVVVRGNRIMDAYNGVRMKADATPIGQMPATNANVHIFENEFIRIRDNPTEPEVAAVNWHVRHNRLIDCHSWFSFDGVGGGFWYYYGNTGRFTSRQGLPSDTEHSMGRVLKLSYEFRAGEGEEEDRDSERVPDRPWYVFNNSWRLRCPLIGGANPAVPSHGEGPDFTARLDFFNNAFIWCDSASDGAWVCENIDLMRNFDWARSPTVRFDDDICQGADYLRFFHPPGRGEARGLEATRPIFANTIDFRLAESSEARGTGRMETLKRAQGQDAPLRAQADGTINRGAVQDYGLMQVPELEAEAATLVSEMLPVA